MGAASAQRARYQTDLLHRGSSRYHHASAAGAIKDEEERGLGGVTGYWY